ncbi:unnamed protein product [Schistosoma curassoni]|uniref:Ovule protein n=1 Tax=Schistosoma curassoni TaxID=6186 RepID=A0A183KLL1_9TREM|nr:unnamed protein product [Schistosoma curassoni]
MSSAYSRSKSESRELEWHLAKLGVLESKLTKDPSKRMNIKLAHSNRIKHIGGELSDDDEEDHETDDDDN